MFYRVLKNTVLLLMIGSISIINSCNKDDEVIDNIKPPSFINLSESFYYEVDLNNRADDKFKVTLFVENLSTANDIFQFPVTVPGTYSILDFGRFVTDFRAYDDNDNEINVTKVSTSQWRLESPGNVYKIEYEIYETWDTPVQENQIYRMGGTSIEDTHVLLNTFGVLGYPAGLKERDFFLELKYPENWTVGTSLEKSDGYYWAEDYDYLADSPILLGEISDVSFTVDNTDINIYSWSEMGVISSSDMSADLNEMIKDASAFLDGLPVDRYSFLYLFEGARSYGALEHSYSSVHVMGEFPYANYGDVIKSIAAHEFFHVVIPLNIHSEIIADFNFAVPTPSEHLWLYEGVTEWASDFMQYRNGSMDLDELFRQFSQKIEVDSYYDPTYSLSEISLDSYTEVGGAQFGNIYNRGSMTAALMDIRLLELSNGQEGLRELILELIDTYGPQNSFPETQFFDVLVNMTYPEMDDFIKNYIRGTEPLPYQDYFDKLGITYDPVGNVFTKNASMTSDQGLLFERWSSNF